jgi:hypothetical protein
MGWHSHENKILLVDASWEEFSLPTAALEKYTDSEIG